MIRLSALCVMHTTCVVCHVQPVAAVMPQARTVRGAVSTSTVTAPSRANTIPAKTVAAAKGKVASKATDKPSAAATAPMDTGMSILWIFLQESIDCGMNVFVNE